MIISHPIQYGKTQAPWTKWSQFTESTSDLKKIELLRNVDLFVEGFANKFQALKYLAGGVEELAIAVATAHALLPERPDSSTVATIDFSAVSLKTPTKFRPMREDEQGIEMGSESIFYVACSELILLIVQAKNTRQSIKQVELLLRDEIKNHRRTDGNIMSLARYYQTKVSLHQWVLKANWDRTRPTTNPLPTNFNSPDIVTSDIEEIVTELLQ